MLERGQRNARLFESRARGTCCPQQIQMGSHYVSFCYLFYYTGRQTFGFAIQGIQKELGLSKSCWDGWARRCSGPMPPDSPSTAI